MNDQSVVSRERANVHPFARSFAVAGALVLVHVIALLALAGEPASAHGVGRILGRDIGITVIAALVIGFIARGSRTPWPWVRYVILVFLVVFGVALVIAIEQIARTR